MAEIIDYYKKSFIWNNNLILCNDLYINKFKNQSYKIYKHWNNIIYEYNNILYDKQNKYFIKNNLLYYLYRDEYLKIFKNTIKIYEKNMLNNYQLKGQIRGFFYKYKKSYKKLYIYNDCLSGYDYDIIYYEYKNNLIYIHWDYPISYDINLIINFKLYV